MRTNNDGKSPTRVPIVRGAKPRPIIELELEYETTSTTPKNGKAKAASRKGKRAKRSKS